MQATPQHTSVFAIACLLFAATLWGVFWIPLRWLETLGLHGIWITFLIYCGTLIYCFPIIVRHQAEFLHSPLLLFLIAVSSGWCNTAFILAMLEGEVVRVILLFYLSPVWATLMARFVLKEQLSRTAYWLLLVAVLGAMTMLWSPQVGYPWPESRADWFALSSGFAFAVMNLFVHMTKAAGIQTKTVSAWLGAILVAGIAAFVRNESIAEASLMSVVYAVLIGMTIMGAMTWAVVYGVTHMPVHRSAVILLFEVVVATVSAYLLTDERMSVLEWLGGLAVIVSAYFSAREHALVELAGDT